MKEYYEEFKGEGLTQILFVIDKRFDKKDAKIYQSIRDKAFSNEVDDYTTIVRTHFPNFGNIEECKEDEKGLKEGKTFMEKIGIKEQKQGRGENIKKFVGYCKGGVVYVDNPSLNDREGENTTVYKNKIEESKSILVKKLESCKKVYKPNELKLEAAIEIYDQCKQM